MFKMRCNNFYIIRGGNIYSFAMHNEPGLLGKLNSEIWFGYE